MLKIMFAKIKFSHFSILIDPLISLLLFPWRYTNCCVSFSRQHVLDAANERFKAETDVSKMLRKIRDSNDILKYMVSSADKPLLKINRQRVINLEQDEEPRKLYMDADMNESDVSITDHYSDKADDGHHVLIKKEFSRSIIRGAGLPENDKAEMLAHNSKTTLQFSKNYSVGSQNAVDTKGKDQSKGGSSSVFKEGGQESGRSNGAKIHPVMDSVSEDIEMQAYDSERKLI